MKETKPLGIRIFFFNSLFPLLFGASFILFPRRIAALNVLMFAFGILEYRDFFVCFCFCTTTGCAQGLLLSLLRDHSLWGFRALGGAGIEPGLATCKASALLTTLLQSLKKTQVLVAHTYLPFAVLFSVGLGVREQSLPIVSQQRHPPVAGQGQEWQVMGRRLPHPVWLLQLWEPSPVSGNKGWAGSLGIWVRPWSPAHIIDSQLLLGISSSNSESFVSFL